MICILTGSFFHIICKTFLKFPRIACTPNRDCKHWTMEARTDVTKKKDRIFIKDLRSYKWNIEQKKQGWFYSREYTCIFFVTNISKGTAFLHQGLTDNDKVMLRQYDTIITREKLNKKKSNVKSTVNSLVSDRPWCPTKWSLTGGGRLREK